MQEASSQTRRHPPCPHCAATHVVLNGANASGTPKFLCRGCHRQFVEHPKIGPVSEEKKALILRLLGERMALRAIARAVPVSRAWLQNFVNELYRDDSLWKLDPPPPPLDVPAKKKSKW